MASEAWPVALRPIVEHLQAGRPGHALEGWRAWLARDAGRADPQTCFQAALLAAHARLYLGQRQDGLAELARGLALGREAGLGAEALRHAPAILASLAATALEEAIEPAYVAGLIGQAGLTAPSPILTRWPYPVRLYTLGRSAIVVHGVARRGQGKAQQRPIQLLHSLLARGGRAVPVTLLRKALWDDPDGNDAQATRGAFDMALNRLRRLLGVDAALQLGDGLLSLNQEICWVDAWACERLLGQVDRMRDPACAVVLLERALTLYQGDFLDGEETAWSILARERMRARLLRVARRLGETLEEAGEWAEAGRLYARLREDFPLDEALCRHLIRSHVARAQWAEASGLYARCRSLFAKLLGVLPGPEIRAMLDACPR